MQSIRQFAYLLLAALIPASGLLSQSAGPATYLEIPSPTVARTFHYQGCLTRPDGTPQPDDTYTIKFEIIDQAISVGAVLFSETAQVQVTK